MSQGTHNFPLLRCKLFPSQLFGHQSWTHNEAAEFNNRSKPFKKGSTTEIWYSWNPECGAQKIEPHNVFDGQQKLWQVKPKQKEKSQSVTETNIWNFSVAGSNQLWFVARIVIVKVFCFGSSSRGQQDNFSFMNVLKVLFVGQHNWSALLENHAWQQSWGKWQVNHH